MDTSESKKHFLNYELTPHQNALVNYLIPSITSLLLFIFLFASDLAVIFRHYKDDNPIWASLTLFIIYLPSLCSYIIIVSNWNLWPEMEGCGYNNFTWFVVKTLEHLFFPVWAMWRYAERLFWSIEAVRSKDEKSIAEAIDIVSAPRSIELYFFLQAFLHSLPQILLQINIFMRQAQEQDVNQQTVDAKILSAVFNLTKVAATVAFYQRFKTQKLAGKQYPWFKSYKSVDQVDFHRRVGIIINKPTSPVTVEPYSTVEPVSAENRQGIDEVDSDSKVGSIQNTPSGQTIEEPVPSDSRRSSDSFYEEPSSAPLKELREVPGTLRETSIIDGPKRILYQEVSEPDFNIKRVARVKGLPEDDLGGKLVSFLWWSCFLVARILSLSASFFFYPDATLYLLLGHVLLVISFLIYDAKADEVKRAKAVFFVFLGLIYIFCIIEFKIKFKKAKFMYYGYFSLVYVQNFVLCMVWWTKNVEDLQNDFWFRYIFYVVAIGSVFSLSSMFLYLSIYKPEKIVVGERVLQ